MVETRRPVLILGSGTDAPNASQWPRDVFENIVVINNAWNVRPDWTHLIFPEDFPSDRRPKDIDAAGQAIVTASDFVPVQNDFGGFVYAGGTMAFTAGYWALGALKPSILAFFGCDMIYGNGKTHFYGKGEADPLRDDVTLQSLEAKSARLMIHAAEQGCLTINLSQQDESRLIFPNMSIEDVPAWTESDVQTKLSDIESALDQDAVSRAQQRERELGYTVPSGRYWEEADRFDAKELRKLDELWLKAVQRH